MLVDLVRAVRDILPAGSLFSPGNRRPGAGHFLQQLLHEILDLDTGEAVPGAVAHVPGADPGRRLDAHIGLDGAHGIAAPSADAHGPDPLLIDVRQGDEIIHSRADVLHTREGILQTAGQAFALALMGGIECQGHIAGPGQIPGVKG